jgi:NAD(P)-dependent dehydrogenase (short-subunit alcohol dehydrogenase family)
MELTGQVAAITGAASGIGAASARAMVAAGACVALLDRDEQAATALAKELNDSGAQAYAVAVDVTERCDIERAIGAVLTRSGRLDIMLCNAGVTRPSRTLDVDEDLWDQVIATNLSGVFWTCQAALRPMKEARYGRVLITASTSALGSPGNASYASTKAAVVAMTRSLAVEFGRYGITVNAVGPGMIETPMTAGVSPEIKQRWIARTAVGRLGEPADIARVFVFLAAPAASYITGQMIFVDGGYTLPSLKP